MDKKKLVVKRKAETKERLDDVKIIYTQPQPEEEQVVFFDERVSRFTVSSNRCWETEDRVNSRRVKKPKAKHNRDLERFMAKEKAWCGVLACRFVESLCGHSCSDNLGTEVSSKR